MGWTYIPGVSEEELYHHGILGQKWGRRRYQNPDGSYTQAGRARYGIFSGRKRKMSRDAKLRAKERTRVKNEEARREAYIAETERKRAQADAERAKTELREAKKQNSLAYKLGSKAAESVANKAEQKRMAKEANKPLSKNASKYIEAIQSGDKRKIERVARKLNNDEYRTAINRINMTYEMDRLKTEASIAKGKQTVQRLTNAANMLSSSADVWNAGAGIISAFSGKNVPKINTKYQDPLDTIKKQLEVKTKAEALRTAVAGANKAEELARQERIKSDTAKRDWDESEAERAPARSAEKYGWKTPSNLFEAPSGESLWTTKTDKSDKYSMSVSSNGEYAIDKLVNDKHISKAAKKQLISTKSTPDELQKASNRATSIRSGVRILSKYDNDELAKKLKPSADVADARNALRQYSSMLTFGQRAKAKKAVDIDKLLKTSTKIDSGSLDLAQKLSNNLVKLDAEIERARFNGKVDVDKLSEEAKALYFGRFKL